ncbi:phosphomannomutase/phosphoglucomutase [Wenxinia marina]|uniref:Phosphomannomutase n=1 Tax=Wenxinia marina DSM 24838 TaxID=1123501 RepID=A0A0D0Q931_9RHOB|nr:phosphomannomutase/phosphoglucomutase [Wenxinia marina]KIQ68882.1 phosphomannomutase [Wenxinia marina DSM 24838]GGL64450.1 phosphomannomutase [Wenxinia marina]
MLPTSAFKSYDIRGRVGVDLDEAVARATGRAFAQVIDPGRVVVGRDVRDSSPMLQAALIAGLRAEGVDVVDLGLCGTEEVYFATDFYGAGGGLMVTASHNPIEWNGIKMVREGARPLAPDGLDAMAGLVAVEGGPSGMAAPGALRQDIPREAYADRVVSYLDTDGLRPIDIVVNAGNGTAGPAFDALAERLEAVGAPFRFHRIDHEPDAAFPNGIPNPLLPENRPRTADAVRRHGADMGVAWDGDFDRCFFFDETGAFVDGEYVVGLLAQAFLRKEAGARIVHDPRVMWNTVDLVRAGGGEPVVSLTGHAHLKAKMREVDAIYGGEMSAHHYFRAFMYCDSGMIPWVLVAELVSRSGRPLSELVEGMRAAYPSSGEMNFRPGDPDAAIAAFEETYLPQAREVDRLDGISLDMGAWRVNLRRSNTEPVVRLNLETRGDRALLDAKTAEVRELLARF